MALHTTTQTSYRIPASSTFIVSSNLLSFDGWIIRDEAPHAEEIERHMNDLYHLFLSKMNDSMRTPHISLQEEERLACLFREIFEFKRMLSDPS